VKSTVTSSLEYPGAPMQRVRAQLAALLRELAHNSVTIDIRASKALLHLKPDCHILDGVFVVSSDVVLDDALKDYDLIRVAPTEAYAANCIRVNDHVLLARRGTRCSLQHLKRGATAWRTLPMVRIRKMDGGVELPIAAILKGCALPVVTSSCGFETLLRHAAGSTIRHACVGWSTDSGPHRLSP